MKRNLTIGELRERALARGRKAVNWEIEGVEALGGFLSAREFGSLIGIDEKDILSMLDRGELFDTSGCRTFTQLTELLRRAEEQLIKAVHSTGYLLADWEWLGSRPLELLRRGDENYFWKVDEHFGSFGEMGG